MVDLLAPQTQLLCHSLDELAALIQSHPEAVAGAELEDLLPVDHAFEGDHYVRRMRAPAGVLCLTKTHKVEHPFFLVRGRCAVVETGREPRELEGPTIGVTEAGVKRIVLTLEETEWVTVHHVPGLQGMTLAEAEVAVFEEGATVEHLEEPA